MWQFVPAISAGRPATDYGPDAFGGWKSSGVEVRARESESGRQGKLLGDMHVLHRSWTVPLEALDVAFTDVDLPV